MSVGVGEAGDPQVDDLTWIDSSPMAHTAVGGDGSDSAPPIDKVKEPLCGWPNKAAQEAADKAYYLKANRRAAEIVAERREQIMNAPPMCKKYVLGEDVEFVTKDSGERQEFPTGSVRDTREGKGRYDLLSPFAIRRLAMVYERGAAKYGDNNWRQGQPLSRFLDSALRHTFAVLDGLYDEDHAGQAVWNLMAFMETQARIDHGELPTSLDDVKRDEF